MDPLESDSLPLSVKTEIPQLIIRPRRDWVPVEWNSILGFSDSAPQTGFQDAFGGIRKLISVTVGVYTVGR